MTNMTPQKPLPFRTAWTESFWDGTKRREFLIQLTTRPVATEEVVSRFPRCKIGSYSRRAANA